MKNNKFIFLPLVLALFSLVCVVGLGSVYVLTHDTIATADEKRANEAFSKAYNKYEKLTGTTVDVLNYETSLPPTSEPVSKISVTLKEIKKALVNDSLIGYVYKIEVVNPPYGSIQYIGGFDFDGKTIALALVSSDQTLNGIIQSNIDSVLDQIYGKTPSEFSDAKTVFTGTTRSGNALFTGLTTASEHVLSLPKA
jgi:Na+-translocating ferredoxin:NAD+ oxidoreductase RnfG subunit